MVQFGTKAETLLTASCHLKTAQVLPQIYFSLRDWELEPPAQIAQISQKGWLHSPLAIRSSAQSEDTSQSSLAGHFRSVLNVCGEKEIYAAIERVIQSYGEKEPHDQILIQPMLQDVRICGVAFSKNPSSGAPYFIINYDDLSGATDSVTGGHGKELKSYFAYKQAAVRHPEPLNRVIALLQELEALFQERSLDIEFAITAAGELYLLQVRPLVAPKPTQNNLNALESALSDIAQKVEQSSKPHPYLHGSRTIYGIMPDWNPAEIVGVRPKPLALSLYKEIITDAIWAYQRDNYGYRKLRGFPLLINFHGLPYIDVRVSFNSFIPADVEDSLSRRLADYYLDRLAEAPNLHDKVEFEIIFSCYTLDLPQRLSVLRDFGFTGEECILLAGHLQRLTNRIIDGSNGLWRQDIQKIHLLEERFATICESSLDPVAKIYWLLEDCKRYGTLPFAGLARAGFIAIQMLRSLIVTGVLTPEEYSLFLESLDTVGSRMTEDLKVLDQKEFLQIYGHLRPGTYDLLSPRYDETPDRYFGKIETDQSHKKPASRFALSLPQLRKIEQLLAEHGLNHDILSFFDFIKSAIEGREWAKFIFTRSLSKILVAFQELGNIAGFTAEECSFADINLIKTLYGSSLNARFVLERSIEEGLAVYSLAKQICLPPLIVDAKDVFAFHMPPSEPNFITLKRAKGLVTFTDTPGALLRESIVFIPSADPGYDWIFSQGIVGFITKYGGVNSHMAIRAAELGIPAIIGAGELLYETWSKAKFLEIDCANRKVLL